MIGVLKLFRKSLLVVMCFLLVLFVNVNITRGQDSDGDGIANEFDNCPLTPNGPNDGTCIKGTLGQSCTSNEQCGTNGFCSMNQEDTFPPQGNSIGDACDCEANFDCDDSVDAEEVTIFLEDFGRSLYNRPCTNQDPCHGDFLCDGDVDADDVTKFLEDFGRSQYGRPCPVCVAVDWCAYKAVLTVEPAWVYLGEAKVKTDLCLDNRSFEVKGVQVDLCEEISGSPINCSTCVGCEMTERTKLFDCAVHERDDGCCRVIIFSKHPDGVINPAICSIVKIDNTFCNPNEPECPKECTTTNCVRIVPTNLKIADISGYPLAAEGIAGEVCFLKCGDVYPPESTPGANDCGDGKVDIFDILEEADLALGTKTPDTCQMIRAEVPTGTPPQCHDPDGEIDIFDVMVIINLALDSQDCCSYYYKGVIY